MISIYIIFLIHFNSVVHCDIENDTELTTTIKSINDYYDLNSVSDYIYDEFKIYSELERNDSFATNLTENYSNELESFQNGLQQIFNLNFEIKNIKNNITIPQFMLDLYNTINDEKTGYMFNNLYKTSIILSIPEVEIKFPNLFKFNITGLKLSEILDAELHIYRIAQRITINDSPYYLLRVYQILIDDNPFSLNPDLHQLLNVHYVYSYTTGWQVFKIKRAIESWINGTNKNYGIYITATTVDNEPIDITFIRSNSYNSKYQPNLIIFTKDDHSFEKNHIEYHPVPEINEGCKKDQLYIDFYEIGLENIVLFPNGFDANKCVGTCDYPFIFKGNNINYTKFKSIIHQLGYVREKPCCIPNKLKSLPILYLDGDIIILKQFSNMIIESCTCR